MITISINKKINNVVISISICKYFMKIQFCLLQPSYLKFYLTLAILEQYISISIHIQFKKKNNNIYKYVIVTDMP